VYNRQAIEGAVMRRLGIVLVVGLVLAAAPVASAKEPTTLRATPIPAGAEPGQTVTLTLRYRMGGEPWRASGQSAVVMLDNRDSGRQLFAEATPTGRAGELKARLRLPREGTWSYSAIDLTGEIWPVGTYRAEAGGGTSLASVELAAAAVLVLLALAAFLVLRRRNRLRRLAVATAALAALLLPAVASGGGLMITVQNRPPAGIAAGQAWNARLLEITCLGRTFDDVAPAVALRDQATGRRLVVTARHVGKGRFVARVVFPSAGTWQYASATDTGAVFRWYGPIWVRAAGQPSSASSLALPAGGGAALLAAALGLAAVRRRRARFTR
jgi:hypothetical protein